MQGAAGGWEGQSPAQAACGRTSKEFLGLLADPSPHTAQKHIHWANPELLLKAKVRTSNKPTKATATS